MAHGPVQHEVLGDTRYRFWTIFKLIGWNRERPLTRPCPPAFPPLFCSLFLGCRLAKGYIESARTRWSLEGGIAISGFVDVEAKQDRVLGISRASTNIDTLNI